MPCCHCGAWIAYPHWRRSEQEPTHRGCLRRYVREEIESSPGGTDTVYWWYVCDCCRALIAIEQIYRDNTFARFFIRSALNNLISYLDTALRDDERVGFWEEIDSLIESECLSQAETALSSADFTLSESSLSVA